MHNGKLIRIQWVPNLIKSENRICLTRIRWERPLKSTKIGLDPNRYSCKLSISLFVKFNHCLIGIFVNGFKNDWWMYIFAIPFIGIRIHFVRSYGGIYP